MENASLSSQYGIRKLSWINTKGLTTPVVGRANEARQPDEKNKLIVIHLVVTWKQICLPATYRSTKLIHTEDI